MFLQTLSGDLILGGWARETLARLRGNPTLTGDPEIDHARSVMLQEDLFDSREEITFAKLMETLRRSCPDNRMAAAFQMSHYLLTRQLDEFVRVVDTGRVKDMGYKEMPRHYAEAILLHESLTGQRLQLHGLSLAPYRGELARFQALMAQRRSGRESLAADLARELPNSYFRYFITGQSGGRDE